MSRSLRTSSRLASSPLALLIVAGFFHLDPKSFAFGPAPAPGAFSSAMLLLVYTYTGFEIAVIPAGEIRDPRRNLLSAILTAIGIVALFYILIQVVCIGTLPELSASDRPLGWSRNLDRRQPERRPSLSHAPSVRHGGARRVDSLSGCD